MNIENAVREWYKGDAARKYMNRDDQQAGALDYLRQKGLTEEDLEILEIRCGTFWIELAGQAMFVVSLGVSTWMDDRRGDGLGGALMLLGLGIWFYGSKRLTCKVRKKPNKASHPTADKP